MPQTTLPVLASGVQARRPRCLRLPPNNACSAPVHDTQVGINAVDDPSAKRGYRLVGDVHFAQAAERAAQITPVPGGVGPMTIAMLLANCVAGATRTFAAEAGTQ